MISLIFISLAAICNAFMDITDRFHEESRLRKLNPLFWDKAKSSNNKWKDGKIANGERFFGSSTFLVWTLSAWHLFKMLMQVFISLAIVFYSPILGLWDIGLVILVWGIFFEITYGYLKINTWKQ